MANTPEASADYVIIGGGMMGLSLAYNLAKRRAGSIIVVDQSYLCSGASGRNGGGVRAQWSSATNIQLMRESIRLCSEFASEMKINVWFRQGGYLFLVRSEEKAKSLEASAKLQEQHGLRTRVLQPQETLKIVPQLNIHATKHQAAVRLATYNPDDGVVFPWPFVWGYAQAASKRGVDVRTHTRVVGFETSKDGARIEAVKTTHGRIRTHQVVNAAGAWSPQIANMLHVHLPNHPHRHEICSSESLKPWLKPLVADLESGLYFSQSTRGEIVGGISNPHVPEGINQESSAEFLKLYAKSLTDTVPILKTVKVLRQWAGCYDITPDANPILGPIDDVECFFQASGFMGHGFMMAPIIGEVLANYLVDRQMTELLERWNLRRFKEGRLLSEAMIIG